MICFKVLGLNHHKIRKNLQKLLDYRYLVLLIIK
jgi:hypothetical protein